MKLNNKFLIRFLFAIFLFVSYNALAQTNIVINYYTGTQQQYVVEDSGKLFFSNDNLIIKTSLESTEINIPVSIISKITFKNSLAVEDIKQNREQIIIYPNPATNYFKISSKDAKSTLNIYNSAGQLVLSKVYKKDEEINVSNLLPGIYFVKVNGSTLKLIKK